MPNSDHEGRILGQDVEFDCIDLLHPLWKATFPGPCRVRRNSGRVCKK